jgi:glycosyltransferase involved in cell wall biosynthesis
MKVLVNTSARFSITPDGRFWAPSENLAHSYWTRFLDVFDHVTILARAFHVNDLPTGARPVSGPGVSVAPLPNYSGMKEFAAHYFSIRRLLQANLSQAHAVYLSLPCVIGDLLWRSLDPGRPFGAGVCGDPYDALAPGAISHPLRPALRWWFSQQLRRECRRACACTYVTRYALQNRYPCKPEVFSTYYSSINLSPEAIANTPRAFTPGSNPKQIINVGTFDTWYKAPDILLEALNRCLKRGLDLSLTLIGDGRHRHEAEQLATKLGVAARVRFAGQLPFSGAVRAELDTADLFVLPSRQEGLPKAMVEAMARGLPCIGTTVGGIPELLPEEDLVPPNDAAVLSCRMEEVLLNPGRMSAMSARNLVTAREYQSDILKNRRTAFYQVLRNRTAEWLKLPSISSLSADNFA